MNVGDQVQKFTGDYKWRGEVRSVFKTKAGKVRIVVEHPADEGGVLHIYSPENLRSISGKFTGMSDDPRCSFTADGTCRMD